MDNSMYQVGFELGKHWIMRDATPEQLRRVERLDDGKDWISAHTAPAQEFTRVIDPVKSHFLGIEDIPSPSFVAGFIDGAKSLKEARTPQDPALGNSKR